MRPKEKKILETLFRIKVLLENLEEQVLIMENENDNLYSENDQIMKEAQDAIQRLEQSDVDDVFPLKKKKKLGRPPGKKNKK